MEGDEWGCINCGCTIDFGHFPEEMNRIIHEQEEARRIKVEVEPVRKTKEPIEKTIRALLPWKEEITNDLYTFGVSTVMKRYNISSSLIYGHKGIIDQWKLNRSLIPDMRGKKTGRNAGRLATCATCPIKQQFEGYRQAVREILKQKGVIVP